MNSEEHPKGFSSFKYLIFETYLEQAFFFFLTCFLFPCYFLNKWNYEVLHLIGRILHIYLDVSFGGTL